MKRHTASKTTTLVLTCLLGACSGSDSPTEAGPQPFAITVSGEVLEAGFDDTTQEWFCRVQVVATASGGDPGTAASWSQSKYRFYHLDGRQWTDYWSIEEMVDRFGSNQIATGETQTTVRRFVAVVDAFDVGIGLWWTLPGDTEPTASSRMYDCF
jgi:hypothetical protein